MWPILVHTNISLFILAVYPAAPSAAKVRFLKNCLTPFPFDRDGAPGYHARQSMNSRYPITQLSPPEREAIHFYYDVCPESPDGQHVVFFAFDQTPSGGGRAKAAPGRVWVAERAGAHPRAVGESVIGGSHDGVRAQWVDKEHIAYLAGEERRHRTVVLSILDGSRREIPGALRMGSPLAPLGLTTLHDFDPDASGLKDAVCVMNLLTGEMRTLFTVADALAIHPGGRTDFPGVEHTCFMHTKWSPDGRRFLVLSSYTPVGAQGDERGGLFVAEADGSGLRYVRAEGHHICWGNDNDSDTIIGFTPNPAGGQDLTAFPVAGGPPRKIIERVHAKHASVNAAMTQVLADVTNAYGFPEKGCGGVYLYDVQNKQPEELATMKMPNPSHSGAHCHPVFSRDEKRVYFNAAEDGFRRFFAIDLN